MKKVCIFDLDGTLIDTLDSLLLSVNLTLDELCLKNITREQCRAFVGNGARVLIEKSIKAVKSSCDEAFIDKGLEIYTRIFSKNCMYKVAPYNGIEAMLKELKNQGVTLAVLSNKPHIQTVEIVENFFGAGYFEYVQGQKADVPRKPDPKSIDFALGQLNSQKNSTIYIGDSEVDMETGVNAGVTTIGVSWGFRDREVLEKFDVYAIVDSTKELLEQIDSIK